MGKIETECLRYDFWKQLLEKSNRKTDLFSRIKKIDSYARQDFLSAGAGVSGVKYQYVILINPPLTRVQLVMEKTKDSNRNKAIFAALKKDEVEIKQEVGSDLEWKMLPDNISSRIERTVENRGLFDRDEWDKIQDNMVEEMIKLEKALGWRIRFFKRTIPAW
jgi:hypothetical protein